VFFFDTRTGKKVGEVKSEHILMAYSASNNKFFTIRSLPGPNQVLFEVAFEHFHKRSSNEIKNEESFSQNEEIHLKSLIEISGLAT